MSLGKKKSSETSRARSRSAIAIASIVAASVLVVTAPAQAVTLPPSTSLLKNAQGANGCKATITASIKQVHGTPAVSSKVDITCPASAGAQIIKANLDLYELMPDGTLRAIDLGGSGQGPGPSTFVGSVVPCWRVGGSGTHDLVVRSYPRVSTTVPWNSADDHPRTNVSTVLKDVCPT